MTTNAVVFFPMRAASCFVHIYNVRTLPQVRMASCPGHTRESFSGVQWPVGDITNSRLEHALI